MPQASSVRAATKALGLRSGRLCGSLLAAFVDDLQCEVLEFGEQGAELFRVLEKGWYSASSAGVSRLVMVLPTILRVHSA